MNYKNKAVVFLTLFAALLSTSCGDGQTVDETTHDFDSTAPEAVSEIISAALPDKDYGGFEFRILTSNEPDNMRTVFEIDAESQNGDIINDAVFNRNAAVEEAFNVQITQIRDEKAVYLNNFTASVMAGDDSYDLLVHQADTIMKNGYLYGLSVDKLPYVDTSREWWDRVIMEQAAIGGVNYGLSGAYNLVDDHATWAIFFNKALASENNVGDLYQMVYDGKWTLDTMRKICADLTRDINGDSVLDYKDQWGMVASRNSGGAMLWSAGGALSSLNKDGALTLTIDTEHNVNAMTKIYELFASGEVLITDRDIPGNVEGMTNWNYAPKVFNDGRALFYGGCVYSLNRFRDMEQEFGYLPNPKYDENQKEYISTAQEWGATMFLVPRTTPDAERTSIILEALSSASEYYVIPAFYDVQLTRKYSRDDESEAILDILFKNRVFDLAYTFNFGSVRNITNVFKESSNTVASMLASLKTAVQTAYEATYEDILASK